MICATSSRVLLSHIVLLHQKVYCALNFIRTTNTKLNQIYMKKNHSNEILFYFARSIFIWQESVSFHVHTRRGARRPIRNSDQFSTTLVLCGAAIVMVNVSLFCVLFRECSPRSRCALILATVQACARARELMLKEVIL